MKKYLTYTIAVILLFAVFFIVILMDRADHSPKVYESEYPVFDNEIVKTDVFGKDADTLYAESDLPDDEDSIYLTEDHVLHGSGEYEDIFLEDVRYARVHMDQIIALKEDGTVWCKGMCFSLGDEQNLIYNDWQQVLDNAKYVMLGQFVYMAITKDNSLYMWGDNTLGQFGDGSLLEEESSEFDPELVFYTEPVKVADDVKMVWSKLPSLPAEGTSDTEEPSLDPDKMRTWILTQADELLVCGEAVGHESKAVSFLAKTGPNAADTVLCTSQLHHVENQE